MSKAPDRKQLRRAYLQKKGKGYTIKTVGAMFFVASMALTLLCVIPTIMMAISSIGGWLVPAHEFLLPDSTFLGFLAASTIFGVIAFASGWVMQTGENIAKVPYVPPVTLSTLPAEEVLVRGAAEPSAPNETLLRAAKENPEMKPEELLRVAPGTTGEQDG